MRTREIETCKWCRQHKHQHVRERFGRNHTCNFCVHHPFYLRIALINFLFFALCVCVCVFFRIWFWFCFLKVRIYHLAMASAFNLAFNNLSFLSHGSSHLILIAFLFSFAALSLSLSHSLSSCLLCCSRFRLFSGALFPLFFALAFILFGLLIRAFH